MSKDVIYKLAHISDAHLDNRQYGLATRRQDFRSSFDQCVERCLLEKVDALLLCGDTFHNEKPDFISLVHFRDSLEALDKAGIDVLAITGNHDKESYTDFCTWIDLFPSVKPLDDNLLGESWRATPVVYDRGGKSILIYGLNWDREVQRSIETKILPSVSEMSRADDITILAIHAGVANVLPQDKGLITDEFLAKVSKSSWKYKKDDPGFNYIALGHIHKPYQRYDAYNPGSLENCSTQEWEYDDRGFIIVSFYSDGSKQVDKFYPQLRPTKSIRIPVSMNSTQEHINLQAFEKLKGIPPSSLVSVELFGNVAEPIPSLVLANLKSFIWNSYSPLYIKVRDNTYVSRRKNDPDVSITPIVEEAFSEIFKENEFIAQKVVDLVNEKAEVGAIIKVVEDHLVADKED